jgi:cob(I)alamin adenosyltransferase|tara:strand:+ start:6547 stop:6801 length:255 start_codon:yes stop_codon:yes gene_type:complete
MSVKSNAEILKEIQKDLHDIKNIVIDINKRSSLHAIELSRVEEQIVNLNNRMPQRKQGWFGGGYWDVSDIKDGLSINYENINKS